MLNATCPCNLGPAGMLESVVYENRYVVFHADATSGMMKLSALSENPKLMKQSVMMNIAALRENAASSILFRLASECGAGVTYHYFNKQTGDDVSCSLTADELASILEHGVSDEELFDINLEMTNLHFPQEINGFKAQRIVTKGNRVVFTYDLGPNASLAALRQNAEVLRKNILQAIPHQDAAGLLFMKLSVKLGKEWVYRYRQGNDEVVIVLTNAELRSNLPGFMGSSAGKRQ